MKVIFTFCFLGALAIAMTFAPGRASAERRYFTTRGVLKNFFPKSERVTYVKFTPNKAERGVIKKRLGYALPKTTYVFYVGMTGERVDGYAIVDDEIGKSLPITFAVQLTPDGVVRRQEVMVYREPWGGEIHDRRFRKQFVGKTKRDPLRTGSDIAVVSGATISSNAMARGVRRTLVLFESAIRKPLRTAATH